MGDLDGTAGVNFVVLVLTVQEFTRENGTEFGKFKQKDLVITIILYVDLKVRPVMYDKFANKR